MYTHCCNILDLAYIHISFQNHKPLCKPLCKSHSNSTNKETSQIANRAHTILEGPAKDLNNRKQPYWPSRSPLVFKEKVKHG